MATTNGPIQRLVLKTNYISKIIHSILFLTNYALFIFCYINRLLAIKDILKDLRYISKIVLLSWVYKKQKPLNLEVKL